MKKTTMFTIISSGILMIAASFVVTATRKPQGPSGPQETYTYDKDIAPIVKTYCVNCHGEDTENPSELSMDDFGSLMKGGKHGPPVVAGKPNESIMYTKLTADPPFGKQMPRGRKKMPPEAIQTIHDWIQQGAKEK